jgi:hypothetical protein
MIVFCIVLLMAFLNLELWRVNTYLEDAKLKATEHYLKTTLKNVISDNINNIIPVAQKVAEGVQNI